ncbi:MAG: DUF1080 domain-containing protein [Bacteroidales bacterium]|nr:DUF1080 domain-containing protein [Bacteroidales bacterium]
MKTKSLLFLLSFVFVLFMVSCKSSTTDKTTEEAVEEEVVEEVWTSLFDGETSTGWRGYNQESFPEGGWEIVDGTLHCIGSGRGEAGGKKGGDIITEKKYKWFEFQLEWKISEGGNSGIFYLAQEKPDQPIWKSSPEMQVIDNEGHPDGRDSTHQAGALYDLIAAVPQNAKPPGEWNQVKILIYKGLVEHWQNGEKVVEYHLWTQDWTDMVLKSKFSEYPDFVEPAEEGYIGLQDHGDDVWYRNIKIKILE